MEAKAGERGATMDEAGGRVAKDCAPCLQRLAGLSARVAVHSCRDIVDLTGALIHPCGARLSPELISALAGKRLRCPIELSLAIEGGVTMERVVEDCLALLARNPVLEALAGGESAQRDLRCLRNLPLTMPLRLMLTAMQTQHHAKYAFCLSTILVSAGLACGVGLGQTDSERLLLSALVHDVGEMYLPLEVSGDGWRLSPDQWQRRTAHVRLGEAFIQSYTEYPPPVAECVSHHHERSNGSGYPGQLQSPQLNSLAPLIGVADTVSAIITRQPSYAEHGVPGGLRERISFALRMIPGEYPAPAVFFVTHALGLVEPCAATPTVGRYADCVLPSLRRLRESRLLAVQLIEQCASSQGAAVLRHASETLRRVESALRDRGVYDLSRPAILESNPGSMGEVCLLIDEVKWRLRHLSRNVYLNAVDVGLAEETAQMAELVGRLDAPV